MGRVVGMTGFGVGFNVVGGVKGTTVGALGSCDGTAVCPASSPIVGSNEGKPVVERLGGSVTSSVVRTGDGRVHIDGFGDELGVNDGRTKMLGCGKTDSIATSESLGMITPLIAAHSGTTATVATTVTTPMAIAAACIEFVTTVCPT